MDRKEKSKPKIYLAGMDDSTCIWRGREWELQLDAPASIQNLPSADKKLSKLNILWIRKGLFLE